MVGGCPRSAKYVVVVVALYAAIPIALLALFCALPPSITLALASTGWQIYGKHH